MLRKVLTAVFLLAVTASYGAAPAPDYKAQAEEALEAYDVDAAESVLDTWRSKLNRRRRPPQDQLDQIDALSSRAARLRTMMARVEALEIVDSISVPKSDFFKAYRLSPEAGRILPPDALGRAGIDARYDSVSTVFMPQNRRELLWAQPDTAGVSQLWGAGFLDDGTVDRPAPLDDVLADGAPAAYPFLMPDGMTLYYASVQDDGLGGYDIFMSRRESDGTFMQPQNMGLPYNSPYDDYMLAIDESNGLGWFATDRNHVPDSLTVYVFVASPVRVNVDAQSDDLAARARLSDISVTQREGVNYRQMLADKTMRSDTNSVRAKIFNLDLGNGTVAHTLADLPGNRSREAMLEYLGAQDEIERCSAELDDLRRRYHSGECDLAPRIMEAESRLSHLRRTATRLRNAVINAL